LENAGDDGPPHFSTLYVAAEVVPHPMVHPLEVSHGWRILSNLSTHNAHYYMEFVTLIVMHVK